MSTQPAGAESEVTARRLLLSRRWLARNVAALVLTLAFVGLGWWQWDRARSGNSLSWAYTFEWPFFAAFVVFFWWKMLHFELSPPAEQPVEEVPAPVPEPEPEPEQDDELAAYNRYLKSLYEQDGKQQ